MGYATTNECYNEKFLSIKSGCYNEHRCYKERIRLLSADVARACTRRVGPSLFIIIGLFRTLILQEIEVPRISRQSAHESGKVVIPTPRPSLPPSRYTWYSFLLRWFDPRVILRPEGLSKWKKSQWPHRELNPWPYPPLLANFETINPLKPELNPICYLLALLGAHHFLHISRIKVKLLTLRRLMSYIYGAPILDVSRSHTTTQHSR